MRSAHAPLRLVGVALGILTATAVTHLAAATPADGAFATGSGPNQAAPPVFPSGVEQVLVDVAVVDGKGRPVFGLKQADFALTEDGIAQTPSSFEAIQDAGARATSHATAPGSLVVVFDDLGLTPTRGERARAAAATLAASSSEGRMSLVTTSGSLRWPPLSGSHSPATLAQTIGHLHGRCASDWAAVQMSEAEAYRIHVEHDAATQGRIEARYRSLDADLGQGTGALVRSYAAAEYQRASTHARVALAALQQAAQGLRGMPGRRLAILISPGFFYEASLPEFRRLLEATREANVTVYFLDASGLDSAALSALGAADTMRGPADEGLLGQRPIGLTGPAGVLESDRSSSAGSEFVAEETGGFVVRRTNDLAGALARIAEDARSYYVLGYVPTNSANVGKYRRIAVKLATTRKGWAVRARRGYYGPPAVGEPPPAPAAGAGVTGPETPLGRPTVTLPGPEGGVLPVTATAQPLEDSRDRPGAVRCLLRATIDLAEVRFLEEHERRLARLSVAFEVTAEGGAAATITLTRETELDLSRSVSLYSSRRWLPVDQEAELAPGAYTVRVTARDVRSGDQGTAGASLNVPVPGLLRLSDRRLSQETETDDTGRPRAAQDVSHAFEAGDSVVLSFDVFGSRPGPNDPIEVTSNIERPGGKVVSAEGVQIIPDPRDGVRAVVRLRIPKGASSGEYRLVGTVTDKRTSRRVRFWEPLTITKTSQASEDAKPAADPELADVLKRAGEYVMEYERTFHDIVAEEEYVQRAPSANSGIPERRRTFADLVFVRLPGPIPWASFRDVYEVDGKAVRDRDQRLERLFARGSTSGLERAEALLAESARYNIGVERTANLPTLPLLFLHAQNQARFSFSRRGGADRANIVEVAYREVSRPTLLRGRRPDQRPDAPAADLPASGRFWIDAKRGTVVRTEMSLGGTGEAEGAAKISTTYRAEPTLAMWVPEEMKELYSLGGGGPVLGGMLRSYMCNGCYTEAVARYRRMRRFQVTTEENAKLPR
jgi:VWFA-related protein